MMNLTTGLLLTLPVQFNEWHLTLGASAHLGRLGVVLLMTLAVLAIALSALSLIEERFGRGWLLLLLRAAGANERTANAPARLRPARLRPDKSSRAPRIGRPV